MSNITWKDFKNDTSKLAIAALIKEIESIRNSIILEHEKKTITEKRTKMYLDLVSESNREIVYLNKLVEKKDKTNNKSIVNSKNILISNLNTLNKIESSFSE